MPPIIVGLKWRIQGSHLTIPAYEARLGTGPSAMYYRCLPVFNPTRVVGPLLPLKGSMRGTQSK